MVVDPGEVLSLFAPGTSSPESVKEVGYDVRLGGQVTRVTRGGQPQTLSEGDTVTVLPGETILAESLEILQLPRNVCATGSPRMRHLLKGLWSHGGKTDFGFSQNLQLGFVNQGTTPIKLEYGERIFNIIFWRVEGPTRPRAGNAVAQQAHTTTSPLETLHRANRQFRKQVMERDGVTAFRIMAVLHSQYRRAMFTMIILGVALLLMTALATLALARPTLATVVAWTEIVVSGAGGLVALIIALVKKMGPDEPDTVAGMERDNN